jgi:hypothetical protein
MIETAEFKIPRGRRSHRLWQELVDSAHALLAIDSARQYGLVQGGPKLNQDRCREILRDGEKRGFRPSPRAFENFVEAYKLPPIKDTNEQ